MSLSSDLLRQYNKRKIDAPAATNTMGLTNVQVNPYAAMYEEFKDDKNFDIRTWQTSLKEGNEDTYLTFLRENKGNTLSEQFYDSSYYNYETQMLELSKPFADNVKKTKYKHEVFDYHKNDWTEEELGEMTGREYLEYQLKQVYGQRAANITKEIERRRKDMMSGLEKFGHNTLATTAEFGEGVAVGVTGVFDFLVAPIAATGLFIANENGDNWLDAYVEYIGEYSLTALEKETLRAYLDKYERTHTSFKDKDGNITTAGKWFTGIANSIGMMVPAMIVTWATGGLGAETAWAPIVSKLGTSTFYTSIYTNNLYENIKNPATAGSPAWLQMSNAAVKSAVEVTIEYALGKVLGGTIGNKLIGLEGKALTEVTKALGKGAGAKYLVKSALQEGLEEFFQDFSTNLVDQFTGQIYEGYEHTGVNFQTLIDSFLIGAVTSMVMSGGVMARNAIGPAPYIEVDGKLKKVRGAKRLAYSDLLSGIESTLKDAKNGKADLESVAQVYATITTLVEFYASFDKSRLEKSEALLQKVIKAEQTTKTKIETANMFELSADGTLKSYLSAEAEGTLDKFTKEQIKTDRKAALKAYGTELHTQFTSMVGDVGKRYATRVKDLLEKAVEDLNEAGVTSTTSMTDKDGNTFTESPLEAKIQNIVLLLSKEYEFLFTTDGQVAVEVDGSLFVPEAWLENYETSEIYKFLEQQNVFKELLADPQLKPMIREIIKHNLKFTKKGATTSKAAIMDFLFNKTVYQDFLLSQDGKNLFAYKEFVTRMHDVIKTMIDTKISKITDTAIAAERRGQLIKIYDQIKQTHREPTMKAIIKWNINPQLIGADSILSEQDRRAINQWQVIKEQNKAAAGGKLGGDYRNRVEDIMSNYEFTDDLRGIIQKHLDGTADGRENIIGMAALNIVDSWVSRDLLYLSGPQGLINFRLKWLDEAKSYVEYTRLSIYALDSLWYDIFTTLEQTGKEDSRIFKKMYEFEMTRDSSDGDGLFNFLKDNMTTLKRVVKKPKFENKKSSIFISPPEAFSTNDFKADIQFKSDILNEFQNEFGLSAEAVYAGDLSELTLTEQIKLAEKFGERTHTEFVTEVLENKLGDDWVVVPAYTVSSFNLNHIYYELRKENIDVKKILTQVHALRNYSDISELERKLLDRQKMLDKKLISREIFNREVKNETLSFLAPDIEKSEKHAVPQFRIAKKIAAENVLQSNFIYGTNGKELSLSAKNNRILDMFSYRELGITGEIIPLRKFIKSDPNDTDPRRNYLLDKTHVQLIYDKDSSYGGWYDNTNDMITLNIAVSKDVIDVLTHETNHAIQYIYGMTRGFHPNTVSKMPEYLNYIMDEYPELFSVKLMRYRDVPLDKGDPSVIEFAAFIGYYLVQGEIFGEYHMHNGKPVKSITMTQAPNGHSYLVSPDGKRKFMIPQMSLETPPLSKKMPKVVAPITKTQAHNAAQRTFENIVRNRADSTETSDTFHTKLARKSNIELTGAVVNKGLSATTQAKATINEIIINAQAMLSQEMREQAKREGRTLDEGSIYYFLKDYYEKNFDGISIDRDGVTHEYVFVDDNAFDDMFSLKVIDKRNDTTGKDLVQNTELGKIYKTLELENLGIPADIKIIVSPDVSTQAVFTKEHPRGVIYVKSNPAMTNADFLNKVNHEFRHILQRYNKFEGGFTTDFKVSAAMIADVKKHVPGIFKDQNLIDAAKNYGVDPDVFIVQEFVYALTGGETQAVNLRSYLLNTKPIYVEEKGGKVTIYMPWYDSKTGEGRHDTAFLAMKGVDEDRAAKVELPRVDKQKKGPTKRVTVTKAESADNNLKYFVKKGEQTQMPPDFKNFIIATTGNESKLPKEIMHFIENGKLTTKALFKWFRNVDWKDVNQYTFDLINRHFFKNDVIKNMKELQELVDSDVRELWAISMILKKEGISDETLLKQNDMQKLLRFLAQDAGGMWREKIKAWIPSFDYYLVTGKDGKTRRMEIHADPGVTEYMRVLAMQYFDGTIAGTFYTVDAVRNMIRRASLYNVTNEGKLVSIDATLTAGKGKGKKAKDTTTGIAQMTEIEDAGNDIIALYDLFDEGRTDEDMIQTIGMAYREQLEVQGLSKQEQMTKMLELITELQQLDSSDILVRYNAARVGDLTGITTEAEVFDTTKDVGSPIRTNVVKNIKNMATRLSNAAIRGEVVWKTLPKEVQDLFELQTYTKDRKKVEIYQLKPEAYSVGRGTVKGSTAFNYKKHDMTQILANRDLLRATLADVKRGTFVSKEVPRVIKDMQNRLDAKTKETIRQAEIIKEQKGQLKETKFRVDKRNKATDTPQNFTLVSNLNMPEVLRKLFDVGFTDMADTLVQFASKDDAGNLYNKDNPKFDGRLKHEVKSWNAFYEANIDTLGALTRTDVLDIVEFIQGGVATLGGPADKVAAFQIFVLGYIVDGARRNFNNWNFSEKEIDVIEKLYEKKASEHGSGMNAVGQMIKVIDPFKKVQQEMFKNFNIDATEKEPLIKATQRLQKAKTQDDRKSAAADVMKELRILEDLMRERQLNPKTGKPIEKGFGKRWYQKLKSWRFTAMLSRPTTWIRNLTSNITVVNINKSADFLGSFVFGTLGKKAYRQDQWNLQGTKISPEVKAFIDNNIKNSELFNLLYDGTTKYNDRKKAVKDQRELFVAMIVNSLEHKYAAENRFDSKTMNRWAGFVNTMISDKRFIKAASTRYLGKILTQQNIDLSQGFTNDVLSSFSEAVILAMEDYMHKRSFMADMIDSLKGKHNFAYELLTLWQPFLNSGFNWFEESLKLTPMGLVKSIFNATKLEERIQKLDERRAKGELVTSSRAAEAMIRRDVGKGILGTLLMGFGIILRFSGRLRIEDDDDKFYLYVGDVKVDITSIFGSSSILVGASLVQISDKDDDKDFYAMFLNATENLFNGFILKDILDSHRYDMSFGEALITETEGVLKSYVPQFVQMFVMSLNNEKIRYSPGFKGMWERYLNSFVPAQPFGNRRINPYTGEIETKYAIPFVGNLLASGILGPKIFWSEVSEIEAFARESGVNKTELTGKFTANGVEYKLDRETLNKKYGELNKKSLAQITQQSHYVQMPDGSYKTLSWSKLSEAQRKRVIDRTMQDNADLAKIYVWTQIEGKKYYAHDNLYKKLKALGMTKNVYRGDKGFV